MRLRKNLIQQLEGLQTEMETISSKHKWDDRAYAGKKNAERCKETLRR